MASSRRDGTRSADGPPPSGSRRFQTYVFASNATGPRDWAKVDASLLKTNREKAHNRLRNRARPPGSPPSNGGRPRSRKGWRTGDAHRRAFRDRESLHESTQGKPPVSTPSAAVRTKLAAVVSGKGPPLTDRKWFWPGASVEAPASVVVLRGMTEPPRHGPLYAEGFAAESGVQRSPGRKLAPRRTRIARSTEDAGASREASNAAVPTRRSIADSSNTRAKQC